MGEIADIYYRGNQKDRDDILKQAVDETKDKNVKTRLREFQKFKENIDVMYDYVDKTYDELGNGPGITRMKESVKELLDEIVVDSLKDEGYILNTISDRIQHKIEDIDNEINDKVNGPNLYDENGRYIQVRDMDRLMMLQHLQSVFDGIKDEIEDVNDARDTGKNSDKVKSGEDWENMSDEEVVDAIFGDEEETGGAVIPEKENETNPETDKAVNKKTETWKEQSKTTEKETETKVTESENKNT